MKQKHWQVSVFDKISETIKNDTFYTTDTEAYLIFELIDEDFTPDSATVTVYNVYGKATINANVEVVDGIVRYEIPEEAIGHPGGWRTQVIFTKDNEDYTTGIIEFDVGGHLLDNKKPAIVDIENWNSFNAHARELIDDWEQLEEIRQANERQRELAESARQNEFETNESTRQSEFETNETSRQTSELVREEAENNRQSTFETNETERQTEFETNEVERESTFEINESARQSNELIREEAEGNRQSTFEENEVGRQSEFEENEQGRESAESGRVLAEQTRVNAENTRAQNYATYNAKITGLEERTNYIEGYIDYRDDDIVGIEADFANSTFTRIAASSGLSAGTDFNVFEPFGGRRRCTVSDNGTVTSYFGDANFAEDGSIGQVMVEQPKFYYKVVPLKMDKVQDGKGFHLRKARYYVSAKHKSGFKIHPAFVRNGKEKNFVYLSAYEGAIYDDSAAAYILDDAQIADFATDKLSSISGTKPASGLTQNLTRANTRKLAQNRGLGWEQAYGATVAATQLLFAIEYASFNTQTAIGTGVSKTDDGETNMAEPTGATTLLGNASGKADNGSITYRGEENFWMNIWKWVDGLNIEAKSMNNLYVADNAFADDLGTTPYQDAGITLAKANGYISAFAYNEKFDWLFFPSETSGNSSVPVGDNFYQNNASNSWLAAMLGGGWAAGAPGGGFYWYVTNAASYRTRSLGGRLVYVPGVVA